MVSQVFLFTLAFDIQHPSCFNKLVIVFVSLGRISCLRFHKFWCYSAHFVYVLYKTPNNYHLTNYWVFSLYFCTLPQKPQLGGGDIFLKSIFSLIYSEALIAYQQNHTDQSYHNERRIKDSCRHKRCNKFGVRINHQPEFIITVHSDLGGRLLWLDVLTAAFSLFSYLKHVFFHCFLSACHNHY